MCAEANRNLAPFVEVTDLADKLAIQGMLAGTAAGLFATRSERVANPTSEPIGKSPACPAEAPGMKPQRS
jgi:hypothetical protein